MPTHAGRPSLAIVVTIAWTVLSILCTITSPASAQKPRPKPPTVPPTQTEKKVIGWTNKKAQELAAEAIEAAKAKDWKLCIEKDRESLRIEEHPYVKHHLAGCYINTEQWAEAYRLEREALTASKREDDPDLARVATSRAAEIMEHVAALKITLHLPKEKAEKVKITIDDERAELRTLVNPGTRHVHAELVDEGERYFYDNSEVTIAAKEEKTLDVILTKSSFNKIELDCMEKATTLDEKQACSTVKRASITAHIGVEMSGYSDTTNVHVLSPSASFSLVSPLGGWNVGGSYLLDFVTAASPDIVSMASRHFRETRHAATLGGSYKIGELTPGLNGSVSSEPDYLSVTGAGSISYEYKKWITPRLGYGFTRDRIGLRNTPFSHYERNLTTHDIEAGVSVVVDKETIVVLGTSLAFLRGEQSKLYRFVPVFTPEAAQNVKPGESADEVNRDRLNTRPREVVPDERDRYAFGGRINHRFMNTSTIRAEERLYIDTWGVKATTTDVRYLYDLGSHLEVSGHARYHLQSGASFYHLAYEAILDEGGNALLLRPYRTGDRELSPMMTITGGLGARIELGETGETALPKYAIVLDGDVMWSKFFQSLYVESRTAVYGTVGFEVDF